MAEEHEEEIWVGEEEVWVEQASQLLPFLADFPAILEGYAGQGEVHKTLFLSFYFLFLLYLENEGWGRCCFCCKGGNR